MWRVFYGSLFYEALNLSQRLSQPYGENFMSVTNNAFKKGLTSYRIERWIWKQWDSQYGIVQVPIFVPFYSWMVNNTYLAVWKQSLSGYRSCRRRTWSFIASTVWITRYILYGTIFLHCWCAGSWSIEKYTMWNMGARIVIVMCRTKLINWLYFWC